MVLLLNYLPWLFLIAALVALWKKRPWTFVILVALMFVITLATPSYMPKPGQPQRTQLEQFEAEELEMQDRLRKNELSQQERGEHINGRLDAIDKLNKRKEESNE
jgi:hypothetical protein